MPAALTGSVKRNTDRVEKCVLRVGVKQVHHLDAAGVRNQAYMNVQFHEAGVAVIEFIHKMQANRHKIKQGRGISLAC